MDYKVGDIVKTKKVHPCGSKEWEILRVGLDFKLKCVRLRTCHYDFKRKIFKDGKIMKKNYKRLLKCLIIITLIAIIGLIIYQIPTTADWGDYESYDGSSSYDSWGSSSYDWGSSSSDWGSSSDYDWGDDYYDDDWSSDYSDYSSGYRSRSNYSGHTNVAGIWIGNWLSVLFYVVIIVVCIYIYKSKKNSDAFFRSQMDENTMAMASIEARRKANRDKLFGVSDQMLEKQIQAIDPLFNKSEFLAWAREIFIKLQYAWSDRNLETIRHLIIPELYEQTNIQVQRYINNKQINVLSKITVNLSRLYSFAQEGDREILRIVLESNMIDYIMDEMSGRILRGDTSTNIVNPYILTFVRKAGVKTPEGGMKVDEINCPNCGGTTEISSSGKCPYCGNIITTRENNWTLTELKRYTPNA